MEAYKFFLEMLYPLPLRHHKMFGVDTFYLDDKILFALRNKENAPEDNGIWLATNKEHHQKLEHKLRSLRNLSSYPIKAWLLLPEDSDLFENNCQVLAELIKNRSPLIGKIPKPKKKKSRG